MFLIQCIPQVEWVNAKFTRLRIYLQMEIAINIQQYREYMKLIRLLMQVTWPYQRSKLRTTEVLTTTVFVRGLKIAQSCTGPPKISYMLTFCWHPSASGSPQRATLWQMLVVKASGVCESKCPYTNPESEDVFYEIECCSIYCLKSFPYSWCTYMSRLFQSFGN